MRTQPRVSICIPTFNQRGYIDLAVNSVLAQCYPDLELVISDNHCTDGTTDYLASLRDERVRVVRPNQHLPMSANWRYGVSHTRGSYVTVLSSDDILHPEYSGKLSRLLDTHPTTAFAYCAASVINAEGSVVAIERHVGGSFFRSGKHELKRFVRGAGCVFCSMMIRRDFYDEVGGFGTWDMVGDWDLELRLLQVGDVAYQDEVLVSYRRWRSPNRDARVLQHLEEIARVYETTIAQVLSRRPDLQKYAKKGRRARALGCAVGLTRLRTGGELREGKRLLLRICASPRVRSVLWLHRVGLFGIICLLAQAKRWLRLRIKALLYGRLLVER